MQLVERRARDLLVGVTLSTDIGEPAFKPRVPLPPMRLQCAGPWRVVAVGKRLVRVSPATGPFAFLATAPRAGFQPRLHVGFTPADRARGNLYRFWKLMAPAHAPQRGGAHAEPLREQLRPVNLIECDRCVLHSAATMQGGLGE